MKEILAVSVLTSIFSLIRLLANPFLLVYAVQTLINPLLTLTLGSYFAALLFLWALR